MNFYLILIMIYGKKSSNSHIKKILENERDILFAAPFISEQFLLSFDFLLAEEKKYRHEVKARKLVARITTDVSIILLPRYENTR